MRTTVDIPEPLLRQARSKAALEGIRMNDVINQALRLFLNQGNDGISPRNKAHLPDHIDLDRNGRFNLPLIRSPHPGKVKISLEQLKKLDDQDDQESHVAAFGR